MIPLENVENMIISYDAAETAMHDEEARLLEEAYHRNSYHGKSNYYKSLPPIRTH